MPLAALRKTMPLHWRVGLTICAPFTRRGRELDGFKIVVTSDGLRARGRQEVDGDSVGGAVFTLIGCSAHAAAAASPFLMMAIHSNDLAPQCWRLVWARGCFWASTGRASTTPKLARRNLTTLPPREWYASVRDGLASIGWYAASFFIPPKIPLLAVRALRPRAAVPSFISFGGRCMPWPFPV